MNIQEIISNKVKVERAENMKTSEQLTLGELILLFEAIENKKDRVRYDFGNFYPFCLDSWRGSYCELAFGYTNIEVSPFVEDVLKELKSAVGKTFGGYKGGDFIMGKTTPVWVSNYGEGNCTAIVGIHRLDWGMWIIDTKYIEY